MEKIGRSVNGTTQFQRNNWNTIRSESIHNILANIHSEEIYKLPNNISDTSKSLLIDTDCIFADERYIRDYNDAVNDDVITNKGDKAEKLMLRILKDNFSDDFKRYPAKSQEIMDMCSERYKIMFEIKNYGKGSRLNRDTYSKVIRDIKISEDYVHVFINIQEEDNSFTKSVYSVKYGCLFVYYKDFTKNLINNLKELCDSNIAINNILNDYADTMVDKKGDIQMNVSNIYTSIRDTFDEIENKFTNNMNTLMTLHTNNVKQLYETLLNKGKFGLENEHHYAIETDDEFINVDKFITSIFNLLILFDSKQKVEFTRKTLEMLYGGTISDSTMKKLTAKYFTSNNVRVNTEYVKDNFPFEHSDDKEKRVRIYQLQTTFSSNELNERKQYVLNFMKNNRDSINWKQEISTDENKVMNSQEEDEYSDDDIESVPEVLNPVIVKDVPKTKPGHKVRNTSSDNCNTNDDEYSSDDDCEEDKNISTISESGFIVKLNEDIIEDENNDEEDKEDNDLEEYKIGTHYTYTRKPGKVNKIIKNKKEPIKFRVSVKLLEFFKDFLLTKIDKIYSGFYTDKIPKLIKEFNEYNETYGNNQFPKAELTWSESRGVYDNLISGITDKIYFRFLLTLYNIEYMKLTINNSKHHFLYCKNDDIIFKQYDEFSESHSNKKTLDITKFIDTYVNYLLWCRENNHLYKMISLRISPKNKDKDKKHVKITDEIRKCLDKRNEMFSKLFPNLQDTNYDICHHRLEQTISKMSVDELVALNDRIFDEKIDWVVGMRNKAVEYKIFMRHYMYCLDNNIKFTEREFRHQNGDRDTSIRTVYSFILKLLRFGKKEKTKEDEKLIKKILQYKEQAETNHLCYELNETGGIKSSCYSSTRPAYK